MRIIPVTIMPVSPLSFEGKRGDMRRRRESRERKKDSYESLKAMREAKKSLEQEQIRYENAQKANAKQTNKAGIKVLAVAVAFMAPIFNFVGFSKGQTENYSKVYVKTFDVKSLSSIADAEPPPPDEECTEVLGISENMTILKRAPLAYENRYSAEQSAEDSLEKLILDPKSKQAFFEFATANSKASKQLGEPLIPYIEKVCKEYGPDVDPKAVLAIVFNESCGDNTLVDKRGAVGFMQLEAITIEDTYLHFPKLEPLNPHKPKDNIKLGVLALQNWINQTDSVMDGYKGYSGRSNYSYYERVMNEVAHMNKYPDVYATMRNGHIAPVNEGCSIELV